MKRARTWIVAWSLVGAATAIVLLGAAGAADPGSKDDPLATVTFVQRHAQFVRHELAAGESLRLGVGAQMVIVDPPYQNIEVNGLDGLRDDLVNLTAGERVDGGSLTAFQHYLNGSSHDLFLRMDRAATVLLCGEWK